VRDIAPPCDDLAPRRPRPTAPDLARRPTEPPPPRYDADAYVDHSQSHLTYHDFVDRELIHFSNADNMRSIPSFVDGLKPGQRKILFACFRRGKSMLKQAAGRIPSPPGRTRLPTRADSSSPPPAPAPAGGQGGAARRLRRRALGAPEHAPRPASLSPLLTPGRRRSPQAYHHGEASLGGTIVGMAQTFVGSNNIALLHGAGQFGTRLMGGKDAASPRYIFCKLPQLTRLIFHPHDDALLEYLEVQPLPPSSPPRPLPFSQAPGPAYPLLPRSP